MVRTGVRGLKLKELEAEQHRTFLYITRFNFSRFTKGLSGDQDHIKAVIKETKRFFALHYMRQKLRLANFPVPRRVFSSEVHEVWKAMILDNRRYERFCEAVFGDMFVHDDRWTKTPTPRQQKLFRWAYRHIFNQSKPNPVVWNCLYK